MGKNVYITAAESKSGKSVIVLGMMQLLMQRLGKVAIFRPIINQPTVPDARDHDINLMLTQFGLKIPYPDTYGFTLNAARELINKGQNEELIDGILTKYKKLENEYDFILCEGTDFTGKEAAFEFELNAQIASNLGCPVVLVANAAEKTVEDVSESTKLVMESLAEKGVDVVGCLLNRARFTKAEEQHVLTELGDGSGKASPAVYVLPEDPALGRPNMHDVLNWLQGEVIFGEQRLSNQVGDYVIAAMQVGNFLEYITPDCLVVTPGDRSDIILGSLSARNSEAYPEVAGIVLTGGIPLPASLQKLLKSWTGTPVPIISTSGHTFQTIQTMSRLYGKIEPGDTRKINTALGYFEKHVDGEELASRIVNRKSSKITPKMFEYNLLEKAKSERMRIVLPEGQDDRILQAADILLRRDVAALTILGDISKIRQEASKLGLDLSRATLIDPLKEPDFEEYCAIYAELRKHKGVTLEQARDLMADPTYYGTMMVKQGKVDGMVSGAINTTAHTIRPAFEIIKTRVKGSIVSSVFFMCLKDRVLVFGDCAVNPNPTPEELAQIAIHSAHTAEVFGIEARVAMLSYSTGESGKGEDVDKVKEAVKLAKAQAPELLLEGPLQYDAAIDPSVALTKMPGNPVAGKATVFIFPDLNTGNNTYKAVQRAADAIAIGPVLQGLNQPVNDLSRGCTVPDIVNTVAITAIQAQAVKASSK